MGRLSTAYFQNEDNLFLARDLLGKRLHTNIDDQYTSGIITETEAYMGVVDAACHAFGGKLTPRTKVMYEAGGVAYIYLNYGVHYLINLVTGPAGIAHCVLIRGIEPLEGLPIMLQRRGLSEVSAKLTAGPGRLTKAMGITGKYNAHSINGEHIWLTDEPKPAPKPGKIEIESGPRIGIGYAGEDMLRPYRFWIKDNPFVSTPPRNHPVIEAPEISGHAFEPSPFPRKGQKKPGHK